MAEHQGIFSIAKQLGLGIGADVAPKHFRVDKYLAEKDMEFVGRDNMGRMLARQLGTGKIAEINIQGIYDEFKFPAELRNELVPVFNTPDNPIQKSPLGFERFALKATGNEKGRVNFLKKRFNGVVVHPEQGLVVNDDGVWYAIDPQGLGDGTAWEKTQELTKDMLDLGDVGISLVSNAAALAITAALVPETGGASLTGTLALGGVLSGAARTSLGRYFGTYEASPEEQVFDIGVETILNMGSQFIAPGMKAGAVGFASAINRFNKTASKATQSLWKGMVTRLSANGNSRAVETLYEEPRAVLNVIKEFSSGANQVDDIIGGVQKEKARVLQRIFEDGVEELPKRFGKMLQGIMDNPKAKAIKFNVYEAIAGFGEEMEKAGFGRVVRVAKDGTILRDIEANLVDEAGKPIVKAVTNLPKGGTFKFQPFSEFEKNAQGVTTPLDSQGLAAIESTLKVLNKAVRGAPQTSGKQAAAMIQRMERQINADAKALFEGKTPASARAIISKTSSSIKEVLRKKFDEVGLRNEYKNMLDLYGQFGDAVRIAREALDDSSGARMRGAVNDLFRKSGQVKQIIKKGGSETQKSLGDSLVDLLGPKGEAMMKRARQLESAEVFAPIWPKITTSNIGAGGIVGGAAFGGFINPVTAGAIAAQASPRGTALQAQAAKNLGVGARSVLNTTVAMGEWLKGLTPKQIRALIKDENLIANVIRQTLQAGDVAEDISGQLTGANE